MKCCENCINNPNNNPYATGVCHCALPAMELQSPRRKFEIDWIRKKFEIDWIPTWTQTTTGTLTKTGNYTFSTSTNDIPSADVVEIVRCEDCIHFDDCAKEIDIVNNGEVHITRIMEWCSHGERREP